MDERKQFKVKDFFISADDSNDWPVHKCRMLRYKKMANITISEEKKKCYRLIQVILITLFKKNMALPIKSILKISGLHL